MSNLGLHAAQSRALYGPVWVFAGVKYYVYSQPVLILIILNFAFLMQVICSATLSHLLQLQLGFEHFLYISLN